MEKNSISKSGIFNPRFLLAFLLCSAGVWLAVFSVAQPTHSTAVVATPARVASVPVPPLEVSMPLSIKRPIAATMEWFASFTNASAPRRMLARGAAGGVGGKSSFAPLAMTPLVSQAVAATISPAARDLPAANEFSAWRDSREEGQLPNRTRQGPPDPLEVDPVIQRSAQTAGMPPVGVSFEGINVGEACETCLPPDTNGAVGPNHYVQMVNSNFQVYNKATGAPLLATKPCAQTPTNQCAPYINSLWAFTPNSECFQHNNGDPIVIYDQLADRWLISQFVTTSTAPAVTYYAQCIAISTSPDPSGTYYLYEFDESTDTFHDYPHIGVWPDGYYMSTNLFPNSGVLFSAGAGAWAFERPKMLLGQPAKFIYFDETPLATTNPKYTPNGQLPATLDGKNPPPAGSPNYFVEVDNTNTPNTPPATGLHDEMHIWKFHVDWANPANSTFGIGSTTPTLKTGFPGQQYAANAGQPNFIIPIADFIASACQIENGPNDCSPEKENPPQATQYLDVLGDRLMHRLTYRNFGDHESLVVSHTADVTPDPSTGVARNGVRWYEVRNVSTTPAVYQQGTFAPFDPTNPLWRWMGSAAMDHSGNLAIGYSSSGPNQFPSLHYAGRLAGDPLNQLAQGEALLFAGLGNEIQVGVFPFRNRWGDYSALTVDPSDDCTFWYTNEYIAANSDILGATWRTHIGSFKFPQCTVATPPLLTLSSRKMHGGAGIFDIPLPQTGTRGVECRSGGANGAYTVVFHFANPVVTCGTAASSSGTASNNPASGGNDCIVNLTGVANAQYVTVTLTGVVDSNGGQGNVPGTFGVLIGDVNGNGVVSNGDVSQIQAEVGAPVTQTNCRKDVNANGTLSNGDVAATQAQVGAQLPSTP
jgi:hypothetical protein